MLRAHFSKRVKFQRMIEQYIFVLGSPLPKFECPVIVRITRFYGFQKRAYDEDNLYASAKQVIDSLKAPKGRSRKGLSVIADDDPKNCKIQLLQEKSPDKISRLLIEVLAI